MSINFTGDVATTILAIGTVITSVGTAAIGWMQVLQAKRSKENGRKIDEVHAATTAIAEQTGTHQTLKEPPP